MSSLPEGAACGTQMAFLDEFTFRAFLEAGIACSQERGDTVAVIQHRGVYPNVLIGAVLIANCLILGNFEPREFHSRRASFSSS